MAMAVAIDTARLALEFIPMMQREIDLATGGRRRFQIHRVSAHATIPFPDSELLRQSLSAFHGEGNYDVSQPKREALDWQAGPDDDLDDAAVLHHLHQQAATVPLLSSPNSRSDHGNAATTLTGSALTASINATTQGRLLSSFHRYSFRHSCLFRKHSESAIITGWIITGLGRVSNQTSLFPYGVQEPYNYEFCICTRKLQDFIVWAGTPRDEYTVFWQLQFDVVDLSSRRTLPTSRLEKRRQTTFNQFFQVSDSPVVEDTSRGNPERRFNGVRHRPDRKVWVAEMKPPRHEKKQDFGNFKTEVEAARAVDAAFYHYGKPELLNFPDTSLQFLSTRPTAPPGLDEKAKVKFVRAEAKLLLKAVAASSPIYSTPTNSLQILELSASSRDACPSDHLPSFSEISWPFSSGSPDDADAAVFQSHQWVNLDSACDIFTAGVQSNSETLNSVQISEQGWNLFEDSSMLAAPSNVVNLSAYKNQSTWLDSLIRSPPALMYSRSPSPSHFQ